MALAEILSANESIDKVVLLKAVLDATYGVSLRLYILLSAEDIYHSLSSQRKSNDHSVRGDFNAIRFLYETYIDSFG